MVWNILFNIINLVLLTHVPAVVLTEDGCGFTNSAMFCQNKTGKFLEADISAEVSSIYIITSDLSAINSEDFSKFIDVGLISIVNSTFSFPTHERLFSELIDLRNVRIINAKVTEEIGKVFANNTNILSLYLSGNKIEAVRKGFVSHLRHVEEIDLSHNEITLIEVGAFDGLTSLRVLNLSQNKIGTSFEPTYLMYAPSKCAVCTESNGIKDCHEYHWNLCKNSEQYDQLLMIPPIVTIHLQENPICSIVTGEVEQVSVNQINSETAVSKHKKLCKVYEKGHCFKHESRRMFLLEACGFNKIPADTVNRDESSVPILKVPTAHDKEIKHISRAAIAREDVIFYGVIVAVVSLGIGVGITYCLVVKGKNIPRRKSKDSFSENHVDNSEIKVSLMKESRLHKAIENNNLREITALLNSGVDPNIMDPIEDLPLHFAARMGHNHIVKELLRKGAYIDALNGKGHAAIHSTIARGHLETVKLLLDKGANVNATNKHGNSPLSQACKETNTEIVRSLLKQGATIHHRNAFGETPIHHAARNGRTETLKLLIDKGSDINICDSRGYTPLHYAAKKGSVEIVQILLAKGESVDVRNNSENTPLHKAAKAGHLETVKYLLEKNADATAANFKGQKPHDVAKEQGHTECGRFLENYVARITERGTHT